MAHLKTYSVYVGHLSKNINKADLQELFSGCGNVVDLFIMENTKNHSFNYGFIRYSEFQMAQRAVSELNNWILQGVPLVVSFAKEPAKRIATEKLVSSYSVVNDKKRQNSKRENADINDLQSTNYVNSTVYLSHLKENCLALNRDLAQYSSAKVEDGINIHTLIEDIKKTEHAKTPKVWGDLSQKNNSLQGIKERLFESAKTKSPDDAMAQKKAQEFLHSLSAVISTINSFLRENMGTIEVSVNGDTKLVNEDHKVLNMPEGMTFPRSGKDTDLGSDVLNGDPSIVHVLQPNPIKLTIPSGLARSDSQTSTKLEDDSNDFISDSGIECDGDMSSSNMLSEIKDSSCKTFSCFDADLSASHSWVSQDSSSLVRSSSSSNSIFSLHSSSLEGDRSPIDAISKTSLDIDPVLISFKGERCGILQTSSCESSWSSGRFNMSHYLGRGRGGNQETCLDKSLTSQGRGYAIRAILHSAKKE